MNNFLVFKPVINTGIITLCMTLLTQSLLASGGIVTPIPSDFSGNDSSSSLTIYNPKPGSAGSIPRVSPDFIGNGGLNLPKMPKGFEHLLSLKFEKDPMLDAKNYLIEGNDYSAGRACLKAAQKTPMGKGWSDRDIDVFRDPGFAKKAEIKKAIIEMPMDVRARFGKKHPNIFSDPKPCTDNTRARMCRQLLARALTDEVQSNYRPKADKNEELLSPEVETAKSQARVELEHSLEQQTKESSVAGHTVKPDKAMLLVVIIDKALAGGNKVAAQGAIELLREINPSAAHALECLGIGGMKFDQLTIPMDPRESLDFDPNKPRIGPITGYDYSADYKMLTQADKGKAIEMGWKAVEAIIAVVVGDAYTEGKKTVQDKASEEARRKAEMKQEYKDYTQCKSAGGAACDQVYPDAVKMEERAKEKKDVFTGQPQKKDGPTPFRPFDPLAGAGSYTGPTIGPGSTPSPERPKEPEFELEETGLKGFAKLSKQNREELIKTRDPNATENFCQQIVQEFSNIQQNRLTMTTFDNPDSTYEGIILDAAGFSGGAMQFENWNDDFMDIMQKEESKDPSLVHEKKNCQVMDPARPE